MILFPRFKKLLQQKIINPILHSSAPAEEVALGAAIGIWIGLTPTVGIQMYLIFLIWCFCRYFLKIRFDLLVGTALVWISNPFTMFFIYYLFLMIGNFILTSLGYNLTPLTYTSFKLHLLFIIDNPILTKTEKIIKSILYLCKDLGFPMIIGSLLIATPTALLTYFPLKKTLNKYRLPVQKNF